MLVKIYGFPLSPFVRKAGVVATEKGLDFEWEPTNPQAGSEEFLKASPFSKIPAMQDGDFLLADSTAIATYLDAQYPEPPLLPAEPRARGRAIWFEEVADTVLIPAGAPVVVNRFLRPRIFGTEGDEAAALAAEQALERPVAYLEGQLGGGGWLEGTYTIGDIAVGSFIRTMSYAGWTVDAARYPRLVAWYGRLCERPAWQQVFAHEKATFAAIGA
jgi:glutathione S-transferase